MANVTAVETMNMYMGTRGTDNTLTRRRTMNDDVKIKGMAGQVTAEVGRHVNKKTEHAPDHVYGQVNKQTKQVADEVSGHTTKKADDKVYELVNKDQAGREGSAREEQENSQEGCSEITRGRKQERSKINEMVYKENVKASQFNSDVLAKGSETAGMKDATVRYYSSTSIFRQKHRRKNLE